MVALSFTAWKPGEVRPAVVDLPVHVPTVTKSPELTATLNPQPDFASRLAWSPDGLTLASLSGHSGDVKLWNVATQQVARTLKGDHPGYSLAFSRNGNTLAVGRSKYDQKAGTSGKVALWDAGTGQLLKTLEHPKPRGITSIVPSSKDHGFIVSEAWQGKGPQEFLTGVTRWDCTTSKPETRWENKGFGQVQISPDGRRSALMLNEYKDGKYKVQIRCRDEESGKELVTLANTTTHQSVYAACFSSDGALLAGADARGNILIWDLASGQVTKTLTDDNRRVMAHVLSPDGKLLAAALADRFGRDHEPGEIVVWDLATGQRLHRLTGHADVVFTLAFSPDSSRLASSGSDRTIHLWKVGTPVSTSQKK
jgi:WD40 repeat protein